ncbi:multiple sugar transport system ATP-binding protein [Kaistia soli DSM 19436]|uniref:Multiple sugar transport system ATP-binding protein n=1 Tax=Kaistia soli DSM 19436 TaxID=1122133 RepID=A0A1M4WVG9_9HYPH|nr:sn-glycerol-3-phosphate ABC transporter ATP-binding protein UgpC [Kaistia soli]SHE84962.1 multiple sugar transport system ATP-binding protein [Kaistia soli DSM 19436]
MARLELKSVRKSYQSVEVIHGIDLAVEDESFTVFVGPSGCGKSTLLRMIAGLEEVTSGEVHLAGRRCDHLLPSARGMAMVFQSYALYPHMSVYENLRFGLVNQKTPKAEIERRINEAAEILQIGHLLQRRPSQLSGGQSQRVAIGRAIVKEPQAFLFDEPLSNLDAELRVKMRSEIVALHRRLKSTMVYVTHDQVEAMTMADRIVVLRDGIVEQTGAPIELYARPRNRFVAGFLGAPQMNFLVAQVESVTEHGLRLSVDEGRATLRAAVSGSGDLVGKTVTVGVRPEHLIHAADGPLKCRLTARELLGAETILFSALPSGERVIASLRGIHDIAEGAFVGYDAAPGYVHVFDTDGTALAPLRSWREDYGAVGSRASAA